jgi:transformation/transcription domain-associated protein
MVVFTTYLQHEPSSLDFFFELIDAITAEELKASPHLYDFIYEQIVSSESVDYWRTLVHKCVDLYTSRTSSQKTKTFLFRYIVNPIFAMDVKRNWDSLFDQKAKGTKLMDRSMTETIHNRLWKPQSLTDTSEETAQLGVDHSRMELLQLTTLLLKHYSGMIQEARKDVIKFAWNYIKLEDIINKYAAYVLIAFFIAVFDTPMKIAIQVYQALLKAHQNEGRSLVMQALELMAPVLKKRMSGGDPKMPRWIQYPRKVLSEESSNLQQLISIFNFIVRHPDLFYEGREHLSSIIITALSKIAQPPNPSTDAKKLALNLIGLIRTWEERTASESGGAFDRASESPQAVKRRADGSAVASSSLTKGFVASPAIRMMLIKYLIQFIAYLPERYPVASPKPKDSNAASTNVLPPAEICRKAVQLLHDLLSPRLWNDLDLDLMLSKKIEEVLLAEMKQDDKPEQFHTRMINTLQIVKVIVNVRSDEWVLQRVPQFQKILEKPIRSENADVQASLHAIDEPEDGSRKLQPTLKRILEVMPEPITDDEGNTEESPSTDFVNFLGAVATEALSNGSYICAINILWTLCQKRPEEIDQHIPQIMKAFQGKMAKDHLAGHSSMPGQPTPPGMRPEGANPPTDPREVEIQTDLVLKTVDILAARMGELGDHKSTQSV